MPVEAKAKSVRPNKIVRYFKNIKAEFVKMTWPSRNEVFKTTGYVLVSILLLAVVLWGYDSLFHTILNAALKLYK